MLRFHLWLNDSCALTKEWVIFLISHCVSAVRATEAGKNKNSKSSSSGLG